MDKKDIATACFKSGFNCAQSVISTFSQEYAMEQEQAFRVAAAFGGGMGRRGATCGAVTGAYMAIGLKYGAIVAEDKAAREKTYALVNQFAEEFQARNGALLCNDLLGVDVSTSDGREFARKEGRFDILCPKFVGDAAEILEEIL